MNAVEHYKEAERLRDAARDAKDSLGPDSWNWAAYFNASAQVHATLALAGATLLASSPITWITGPDQES